MQAAVSAICETLKNHDNFLIVAHAMPDGDAIGAQLGLALILQKLNKNFRCYNVSGYPAVFDWANPGFAFAQSLDELGDFKPEVCIFADCGDSLRAGEEMARCLHDKVFPLTVSIDHHRENPEFADINWVNPDASAASCMVGKIAGELNIPLQDWLGQAVYLGLVEDTGSFSYGNTDAETLSMAAEIVKLGLSVGRFNACLENTWSLKRFCFWGELSSRINLAHAGSIAYVCVTRQMLEAAGLDVSDLSDFASTLRRIRGVKISALVRENGENRVKISMRSALGVNVQKVAGKFGGGGHKNAAAMELSGNIDEALQAVLPEMIRAADAAEPESSIFSRPLSENKASDAPELSEPWLCAMSETFKAKLTNKVDGILVINKPRGPSSTQCLSRVKRALGVKKAGHAGTLDPMADGVLLLLLGQATKLSSYLMGRKTYSGIIELGRTTDTWDAEGQTIETKDIDNISLLQVRQAVEDWISLKEQAVPPYSAAKHQGQPLYRLSRKGEAVPQKTKTIEIFRAELLDFTPPCLKFRVECSSGTYIRSLAHSLGIRLGTGATLTALTREYSHPFSLDQAVSASEACDNPEAALKRVVGLADSLPGWVKITLSADEARAVRNGLPVPLREKLAPGAKALLLDENGAPLALAEAAQEAENSVLKMLRGLWQ
ncbi:MAG: tRNA pseudouridine(55) synthase TruB [Desulfovibrionaceae bacterium]|nr:tRNA pseudouridine(55) synthase TruB [Desulfovibrionaceae bacterium]